MGLKILTNETLGRRHQGNPDRDNPQDTFDCAAKLEGTLRAARELTTLTEQAAPQGTASIAPSLLAAGTSAEITPIVMVESVRSVSRAELELAHTSEYLDKFAERDRVARTQVGVIEFGREAGISAGTYEAACSAVGASLEMVDHILEEANQTGFALVWPPGHHAEPDGAMGFCYLNNVAVAARYARDRPQQVRPESSNRVLVIDIDHHAGNGTRSALANQRDILLVDLDYVAAYDERLKQYVDHDIDPKTGALSNSGKEYPYRRDDASIGAVAYPIVQADNIIEQRFPKTSPEVLVDTFTDKVLPKIKEFKPDVILWSLGIDSAAGDWLGGLGHVPGSFYTLIRGLRLLFPEARHGGVLEGGYDPENWKRVLPTCLYAFHHPADDPKNHSNFFARRRSVFEP